jgi:hypothetical protein
LRRPRRRSASSSRASMPWRSEASTWTDLYWIGLQPRASHRTLAVRASGKARLLPSLPGTRLAGRLAFPDAPPAMVG